MIRISASNLESFRFWKDSEAPQSNLIERLTHAAKPTPQMEAGRAFAKMMERANHDTIGTATVDDWAFDFTAMTAEISIPTLREIKAEKVYATPSGPVTLVAKCDGLTGRTVTDDKLTEKWDAEKYLDSLQWRVYLELFEADRFVYEVFVGKYNLNDDRPAAPGQVPPNRWVDIRNHPPHDVQPLPAARWRRAAGGQRAGSNHHRIRSGPGDAGREGNRQGDDMSEITSITKKGSPSWEAHELVLDGLPDERLNDEIADEAILNMAALGQLQPVLVRANGKGLEVVEGRQRVKRALVINHLAGRHAYEGPLSSVKKAINRLTGSNLGKRVIAEAPKGIKVLVTVHRGDEKEAMRAAVAANEHRHDDALERKIRKAKRLAKQGFAPEEIAEDFGVSVATAKRWLTVEADKPKGTRGKQSTAPTRAKLSAYHERLTAPDADEKAAKWAPVFAWLAGKGSRAAVYEAFPELEKYLGGKKR